jgi:hypothetical protein
MPTLMNSRGEMVDLTTGEVVGRAEGVPTTTADPRAGGPNAPDIQTQGGDRVSGLLNNLSWGFNSALFAIPDAAQRMIGKGMGMDEKDVFQFTRLFNKGVQAPRNVEERYARAIGEGVGGTMPFTGILAYAGATRPLVSAAKPATGILKGIADDAIKYVQQSPRAAAALDIAFGAGYEGLRQTVKETVDDSNPYKKIYEELLPAAAFIGLPVAAANLPSVRSVKFLSDKVKGASSGLGEIEKETLQGLPGMYRLPIINVLPTMLMKRAEGKLAQVFGPISESPEAQQALKQLEAALADPRVANAGFLFDAAEKTMYAPLVQRKAELLQQLGPKELEITKERINKNQQALDSLFASFSPESRKPIQEAFTAAQADRQQFFEGLLKGQKDLTDAEVMSISERLGPQNIDLLNDELRGTLMARMEMDAKARGDILRRMGLKQAVSPEGLPMPTREEGKSLFPARDIEEAAKELIAKYSPERPSMSVQVPEPIRLLKNFVRTQEIARAKIEADQLMKLTDQAILSDLADMGRSEIDPALIQTAINSARQLVGVATEKVAKGKSGKGMLGISDLAKGMKQLQLNPDGTANVFVTPGTSVQINPAQLKIRAALIAENETAIDLNLPEALDYLQSAMRFRNQSVINYNGSMKRGSSRIQDAQRHIDTGNAIYKDIEGLVLNNVPRIKQEYDGMKMILEDYSAAYEKNLPLLLTQKTRGGDEFLLPNERLLQTAFSSADNLKQLQLAVSGSPQANSLIERGAIDWLRSKNVVNADGLVDPKKIRQVLDKNKNIVEALPANLQMRLQDEVKFADEYVKRMGEIDARRVNAKDQELDGLLAKATRPGADPSQTLQTALRDPATMSTLVRGIEKDPEMMAALRRSVFDVATGGAQKGGALKSFIDNNEASLKVLFKNTAHLEDLKTLADLQRRVNAFADVTGQIPAFESTDQAMKRLFGAGIQFLTTTAREAAVGRIAPSTGALAVMLRMAGGLENQIYQRIFTRALEDAEFAKRITHVGTPAEAQKLAASLEQIGIPRSAFLPENITRAAVQTTAQAAMGEQPEDIGNLGKLPVVPGTSAQQMLKAMPPAPPTRGTNFNPRLPTTPPAAPAGGASNVQLMYPSMFPNDPISGLLQQRQAQIQAPQQ